LGDRGFGGENDIQILKIPLGLEIRQEGISKKHTWAQFGLYEVPRNQLQSGATHTNFGVAHRQFWPVFHSAAQNFTQF